MWDTLAIIALLLVIFLPEIRVKLGVSSDVYEEADEVSASEGLKELALAIVEAQKAFDAAPQVHLASWHLGLARDWFESAQTAFRDDEDYDQTLINVDTGMFYARLAVELVAEYRFHFETLTGRPTSAGAQDTPVLHAEVALVGTKPIAPVSAPGVTETVTADAQPQPATTTGATEAVETVNAPVVTPVTTPALPLVGAENTDTPDYCNVRDDSDAEAAMPTWRKLVLLIVRTQAVIDAKTRVQYPRFNDANRYLETATACLYAANERDWDDVPAHLEDGLFYVRLSQKVAQQILAAHDVTVQLADMKWDTGDDPDSDAEEAFDATADMALAVAAARVSLARRGNQPSVAAYHLTLAEPFIDSARDNIRSGDYDDAKQDALKGTFHGRLAGESVAAYDKECVDLSHGDASTIAVTPASPQPDYLTSDDGDQDEAWEAWRNLTLKVTKLQALLDTKCAGFADGGSHLKSAQTFVARAQDASDWEDVPAVAEAGDVFIEIAAEAAKKFADSAVV